MFSEPSNARQPEPSEKDVLDDEKKLIELSRGERLPNGADSNIWCGLGLSGGGIRSATLALGVLQAFAENKLLRHFDYISSVSGGGYLAGALQWWWKPGKRQDDSKSNAPTFGLDPENFPYGLVKPVQSTAESRPLGQKNLEFLRAHGAYLTPSKAINAWSMLGVVLRTISISTLIWFPILVGSFIFVNGIDAWLESTPWLRQQLGHLWKPLGSFVTYSWITNCTTFECDLLSFPALYALMLLGFYGIVAAFISAALIFAFISRKSESSGPLLTAVRICLVGGALIWLLGYSYVQLDTLDFTLLMAIVLSVIFLIGALATLIADLATPKSMSASYWLRRTSERFLGQAFIPALVLLAIATVPIPPMFAGKAVASAGGVLGLIGGVASALYGYYTFIRNIVPSFASKIALTIGSALFLYMNLIAAYVLSLVFIHAKHLDFGTEEIFIASSVLILVSFILWFRANINYVGLHRFYRDRLMEAFMPTDSAVSAMRSGESPVADGLSIATLKDSLKSGDERGTPCPAPYPLINSNVILTNDTNQKYASRGGDNFITSPLYVGSTATGWQKTEEYIDRNGSMTLATAVAASGAAATASAGYIGTGITMNPFVAAAMSALNIRLGLWIGNPSRRKSRKIQSIPTFFSPGLSALFSKGHRRDSKFIELTDGGHFENLGLYELVRRKLNVIIIVDGEADPTISLSSLVSATRRIEQDFNAGLTFFPNRGPERLIMYPSEGYPLGVKYAKAAFLVGRLVYDNKTEGTLIYIKSTLIQNLNFTTSGYLAKNSAFPHQSTADQFFDPDQFDAYRNLGYESASQMIAALDLVNTIRDPKAIRQKYCT